MWRKAVGGWIVGWLAGWLVKERRRLGGGVFAVMATRVWNQLDIIDQ